MKLSPSRKNITCTPRAIFLGMLVLYGLSGARAKDGDSFQAHGTTPRGYNP
jgi:hypothetical protein